MIKVFYTNEFGPKEEIVSGEITIREFLTSHNVMIPVGYTVCVSGTYVKRDDLDQPLNDFASDDAVSVATVAKMDNANS